MAELSARILLLTLGVETEPLIVWTSALQIGSNSEYPQRRCRLLCRARNPNEAGMAWSLHGGVPKGMLSEPYFLELHSAGSAYPVRIGIARFAHPGDRGRLGWRC